MDMQDYKLNMIKSNLKEKINLAIKSLKKTEKSEEINIYKAFIEGAQYGLTLIENYDEIFEEKENC